MKYGVFGTGMVGQALATKLVAMGHKREIRHCTFPHLLFRYSLRVLFVPMKRGGRDSEPFRYVPP